MTWQSVFWAVVPIALNSMSQPSGRILGYPSTYNFALRCSPIVCALSGIDSIVRLIAYTIAEGGLSEGTRRFVAVRFEDRQHNDDGSFDSLRKNTTFRILLFVLGAVPQLVKVYATRGIPWTQAWCMAFLASFAVDEAFLLVARLQGIQALPVPTPQTQTHYRVRLLPIYELYARLVLWASGAFAYGFFTHGFYELTDRLFGKAGLTRAVGFVACSLLWLSFAALPAFEVIAVIFSVLTIPATVATMMYLPAVFVFGVFSARPHDSAVSEIFAALIYGATATLALGSTVIAFERLSRVIAPQRARYVHFGLGTYFMCLHFAAAALYYCLVYDPSMTRKPVWTNWLG